MERERERFNETVPINSILKDGGLLMKNRTVGLRECSSREKLTKNVDSYNDNCGKRIKTNIPASLNTSRDKRDKKHTTKTEEDERRMKSKANYKTEANTMVKTSANNTTTEKQSAK